ncbi:hypothetical protein BGZ60DRAFT_514263 [Tricladium varicosporioides]|nr:hypothetical protein BGZ60DRAFT_514263 [Hymenoscyphus varicosporioides]
MYLPTFNLRNREDPHATAQMLVCDALVPTFQQRENSALIQDKQYPECGESLPVDLELRGTRGSSQAALLHILWSFHPHSLAEDAGRSSAAFPTTIAHLLAGTNSPTSAWQTQMQMQRSTLVAEMENVVTLARGADIVMSNGLGSLETCLKACPFLTSRDLRLRT